MDVAQTDKSHSNLLSKDESFLTVLWQYEIGDHRIKNEEREGWKVSNGVEEKKYDLEPKEKVSTKLKCEYRSYHWLG